ncbi:MAG: hypothetical protein ACK5RG_01475 [Cyclobacteriaceae bacterium]|jgi:hypothetical protein|nr:hypothetical protein [Flammeovirgaceae bacterium]
MEYAQTICRLYYLMIHADGDVTESELRVGKQIMKLEGLAEAMLEAEFENCRLLSKPELTDLCISSLNRLTTKYQIRSLAWMYIVSEIDWAVDKTERLVIEQILANTVKVPHSEIALVESELSKNLVSFQELV